jgi:glycosyltransferase involved in cell wall biosynthesis
MTTNIRLCFLAPGNSVHSYKWIKYFAQKGYEVHCISLVPNTMEKIPGVVSYVMPNVRRSIVSFARGAWSIRRLLRRVNPHIFHVHSAGIYGLMGVTANFHPMVLTAWGSDILINGKSTLLRPFVKHILRKADVVTSDAEHMIQAMNFLGKEKEQMTIIRFGVDTDRFKPATPDVDLLKLLGVWGDPTVISLRNFHPIYDIQTLLKSIPYVLEQVPSTKFILVGTGPQKEDLEQLAQSLGLEDSVKFVGKLPNEDLPRYLASMDVYVSTSLSDAGIAASTAEAMACGLASIVTDSGENRLWIKDGIDGYVVPVSNPQQLAKSIIKLIIDEPLRKAFSERGRQVIAERNDYYKEMAEMGIIYDKLSSGTMPVFPKN